MDKKPKKKAKPKVKKDLESPSNKLTIKQRRFIEEYCRDFNATKAATRAGYSIHTAGSIGHENLTKPEIKAAIDARIDGLTMTANEALVRMTSFARGSFKPFLKVSEQGEAQYLAVDLYSDDAQENIHLIKKIKQTKSIIGETMVNITTEIELHDAKDATVKVLQLHGKLIDKKQVDHTSNGKEIEKTTIVFGKGSNVETGSTQ